MLAKEGAHRLRKLLWTFDQNRRPASGNCRFASLEHLHLGPLNIDFHSRREVERLSKRIDPHGDDGSQFRTLNLMIVPRPRIL